VEKDQPQLSCPVQGQLCRAGVPDLGMERERPMKSWHLLAVPQWSCPPPLQLASLPISHPSVCPSTCPSSSCPGPPSFLGLHALLLVVGDAAPIACAQPYFPVWEMRLLPHFSVHRFIGDLLYASAGGNPIAQTSFLSGLVLEGWGLSVNRERIGRA
jgi:hypothetical protein